MLELSGHYGFILSSNLSLRMGLGVSAWQVHMVKAESPGWEADGTYSELQSAGQTEFSFLPKPEETFIKKRQTWFRPFADLSLDWVPMEP